MHVIHGNEKWKTSVKVRKELPLRSDSLGLLIHLRTEAIGLVGIQAPGFDIQPQTWMCAFQPLRTWSVSEMHDPNEHKRHETCWGALFGKPHLCDVAFEVQVDTLSCFPVMPLDVFPSKAQKRVHAHIETSFWILQGMTQTVTAGKELDRTGGAQHTEKNPKNCRPFLIRHTLKIRFSQHIMVFTLSVL